MASRMLENQIHHIMPATAAGQPILSQGQLRTSSIFKENSQKTPNLFIESIRLASGASVDVRPRFKCIIFTYV